MKRYILTGTPGCGKTTLLHALAELGYTAVPEAATEIIANAHEQGLDEPWTHPQFIDDIIALQKARQIALDENTNGIQFYDRSPICTYALARYLNFEPSLQLLSEIKRMRSEAIYQTSVFFLDNLGRCEPTAARRISFEEALKFEAIHQNAYDHFDFHCIHIPAVTVSERVALILQNIEND